MEIQDVRASTLSQCELLFHMKRSNHLLIGPSSQTTHELLVVIEASADILLGGTDERARPKNINTSSESYTTVTLDVGDALLLPAGYAHRMIKGKPGFTMIGSYPMASEKWDSECIHSFR